MVPRECRTSFGVEPSAGPEVEKYSTPLMLRWIARCTSDCTRSEIEAKSNPVGAFISALPPMVDAWCAAAAPSRHRLVGEGVESLLHLANHCLPDRGRVVAFVGHSALLQIQSTSACHASSSLCHTTPLLRAGQQRAITAVSKAFCTASNRGIGS